MPASIALSGQAEHFGAGVLLALTDRAVVSNDFFAGCRRRQRVVASSEAKPRNQSLNRAKLFAAMARRIRRCEFLAFRGSSWSGRSGRSLPPLTFRALRSRAPPDVLTIARGRQRRRDSPSDIERVFLLPGREMPHVGVPLLQLQLGVRSAELVAEILLRQR